MNLLRRYWVWVKRIGHCRGFGIQSPGDYWLVRYVINEHWPYYQYDTLRKDDDWLTRKLGRLYLRIANWRQPAIITDSCPSPYWQAGCKKAAVADDADRIELMRLRVGEEDCRTALERAYGKTDSQSVVVLEGIWRDRELWQEVVADNRTGVTFDLYYCGIVMFDKKREKHNYIINF